MQVPQFATCTQLKASSSRNTALRGRANLRQGTDTRVVARVETAAVGRFSRLYKNWVDFKRVSPHCGVINSDAFVAASSVILCVIDPFSSPL